MTTEEVVILLLTWAVSVIIAYKIGYYTGKIDAAIEREEK